MVLYKSKEIIQIFFIHLSSYKTNTKIKKIKIKTVAISNLALRT